MLLKTFAQLFKRPKSKASAWDAAGSGKRLTYWQPGSSAINSLLGNHLETLRGRARDMVRKNPYASNRPLRKVWFSQFHIINSCN